MLRFACGSTHRLADDRGPRLISGGSGDSSGVQVLFNYFGSNAATAAWGDVKPFGIALPAAGHWSEPFRPAPPPALGRELAKYVVKNNLQPVHP